MAEHLDPYGTWGDWDLQRFTVEVPRWRDTEHPPAEVYTIVDQWWRRLKQPLDRTGAVRVSREIDTEGNLWWMWVPAADWIDDEAGYFRVQCYFRLYEDDRPPRVVCDGLRAVRAMSRAEVDRTGGAG